MIYSSGTADLCVPKIPKITQNFKILKDVTTFSTLFSTPLHEKSLLRPFWAENWQKWRYHISATTDEFSKKIIYVSIGRHGRYQSSILDDNRPYGMIFIHTGRLKLGCAPRGSPSPFPRGPRQDFRPRFPGDRLMMTPGRRGRIKIRGFYKKSTKIVLKIKKCIEIRKSSSNVNLCSP